MSRLWAVQLMFAGAGATKRTNQPIFKDVMNITHKESTFPLHILNKFAVVWIAGKFVLHAEAPDVCDFLHIWQVLVLIVHPSADRALDENINNAWWRWGGWRKPASCCARIWVITLGWYVIAFAPMSDSMINIQALIVDHLTAVI